MGCAQGPGERQEEEGLYGIYGRELLVPGAGRRPAFEFMIVVI